MLRHRRVGEHRIADIAVGDDIVAQAQMVKGMTAVIGSTDDVSTSPSCSIQPMMLSSSGAMRAASSSVIAMRARLAIFFTVAISTDMAARLASPAVGAQPIRA